MRLLLDENLPKRLKQDLKEHEIYTAADKGWTGISNGKLLGLLIENEFDALLTFDKNLQYQRNFTKYTIVIVVLNAPDNSYMTLKNLVQKIKDVLTTDMKPGPTENKLKGPAGNSGYDPLLFDYFLEPKLRLIAKRYRQCPSCNGTNSPRQ